MKKLKLHYKQRKRLCVVWIDDDAGIHFFICVEQNVKLKHVFFIFILCVKSVPLIFSQKICTPWLHPGGLRKRFIIITGLASCCLQDRGVF